MAYSGQTYSIPCDAGGFNHNRNIDAIPPTAMVDGTKNINLHEGARRKRGGTAKYNSTAVSGGQEIVGIYNYQKQDGTNYLVVATTDGKTWYSDLSGSATFSAIDTGLKTETRFSFETVDDDLFIAIEGAAPRIWTGSSTSTAMTSIPSDWTGSNFPKQFIRHGYGASEALWALGFADGSVYCSKDGDYDDFSDAEVLNIKINVGDSAGIVGGFEYGDRLFAVGRHQVYIIDDTDSSRSNWGYQTAQWKGGAAHHRLIVRIPNDVVLMSEDGEIFSVVAAENYGDYKAASLTRPAKMDNWIRANLSLSDIDKFHACYDPILRAIKFFVVRSGQVEVDTCLVYFIDRKAEEAWSIHDNTSDASGYSASCSALVNKSTGTHEILTGDYSGYVWKLEQAAKSDDSQAFLGKFKTPVMHFGDPRGYKHFHALRLIMQPQGNYDLKVDWWVDDVQQEAGTITTAASGVLLGVFMLDTDTLGGITLQDSSMQLGRIGKRIQFAVYNNGVNEDFFISQLLIDFKPLGRRDN